MGLREGSALDMLGRGCTLALALGLLMVAVSADSPVELGQIASAKATLHKMAQDRLAKVTTSVHAAQAPVPSPATPELHKSVQAGPSYDDADEAIKNKMIPQSHLSMSGSSAGGTGTYGVLRAAGGALGLNKFAEDSAHGKKAKPLNQALTKFMTAHNPKTAWSHAIVLVSIIGGTVVTLTAVGTYFIASAEAKRLKKAKKNSNLLGGRYGAVKGEDDSDDEPPPVYEPMMMTDVV